MWSYPWKFGVLLTTEDVCCDVGKVIDVGVKMGGVMADGAITTKQRNRRSKVVRDIQNKLARYACPLDLEKEQTGRCCGK
jgi:hypothetical protein